MNGNATLLSRSMFLKTNGRHKSTADRDKTFKRDLCESNGVGVYVLLDPDVETMQVYRRDDAGNWESVLVEDSIKLQICDDCTIELSKRRLFGTTHK